MGFNGLRWVETWPLHSMEDVDLSGLSLPGVDPAASVAVAGGLQQGLFGPQGAFRRRSATTANGTEPPPTAAPDPCPA